MKRWTGIALSWAACLCGPAAATVYELPANGSAVFGIDAKVPGMKFGTLSITPVKGGRLVGMNEEAARRVPGVRDVIRAGDHAVALFEKQRGALFLLLAAGGERAGEHREEADAQRFGGLREHL